MKNKGKIITLILSIIGIIISSFRVDNNIGWIGVLVVSGLTFLTLGMYLFIICDNDF